jgi:hypothetical protein
LKEVCNELANARPPMDLSLTFIIAMDCLSHVLNPSESPIERTAAERGQLHNDFVICTTNIFGPCGPIRLLATFSTLLEISAHL